MFTCSACGAVTAQAIGLGVSMAATPILFPLHKNTSTPSLARHHTQCEPVHGNTFQPELHHKMLSTSPVSNPALGPMDASGSCRGHEDNLCPLTFCIRNTHAWILDSCVMGSRSKPTKRLRISASGFGQNHKFGHGPQDNLEMTGDHLVSHKWVRSLLDY